MYGNFVRKDGAFTKPSFRRLAVPKETNPNNLPDQIVSILIGADRCPKCLGYLARTMICKQCTYDARPWHEASKARHDAAHDKREG